jgi:hypothetical protein
MALETWNVGLWININTYDSDFVVLFISFTVVVRLPDTFPDVSRSQPGSPGLCLCAGPLQRISGRIDQASDASMGLLT